MATNNSTKGNNVTTDSKKGATTMNNNVLSINLATAKEATIYKAIATALDNISTSAFEVGVYGAYLNGVEIPSYTTKGAKGVHVPACKHDTTSISNIVNNEYIVNKSRSTVSRMVGAVRRLTDDSAEVFNLFSTGQLPFTYDKIYLYYDNKEAMTANGIKSLKEAFEKSVRDLKDIVAKANTPTKDGEDTMVNFTYDGKKYSVKKSAMESFLKGCTIIKRGK